MLRSRPWVPLTSSVLVYIAVTAILGREVLGHLANGIASDAGDPLFTATLMYWNATHVPLTDAWWQFPAFYPIRDTLTFSEHLLGLTVLTSPIYWLTRDIFITYNLTMLLTYPLCAAAMYLLVRRLTGSAAAAFVAGLAFGFTPYRVPHLPHVQMLAVFWTPVVFLALHAYIDTGKRRWLALYAASWLLQTASNNYLLVLLSTLVGLWVIWFVVARRRWKDTAYIATATLAAAVPLAPIVFRYLTVHAQHGFYRSLDEMREFSADVAAVLCAPASLTFWGWLRVHCQVEADLFPGLVVLAVAAIAVIQVARGRTFELGRLKAAPTRSDSLESAVGEPELRHRSRRVLSIMRWIALLVAVIYAGLVAAVLVGGPLRLDLGALTISASSIEKPFVIALGAAAAVLLLSPGVHAAARQSSALGFYTLAALVMWMLAFGPTVAFMGRRMSVPGPFLWLTMVPGVSGLRVPARFWLMALFCLVTALGLLTAAFLRGRSRTTAAAAIVALSALVLIDGWAPIPVAELPPMPRNPGRLAGKIVLELPPDSTARDVTAQYRAVVGGWRLVNGYSGYAPKYYAALRDAARFEEAEMFPPLRALGDLEVIVPREAPRLRALVERQPGASLQVEGGWEWQFHLPRQPFHHPARPSGHLLPIVRLQSNCSPESLAGVIDGDTSSRWRCDRNDEPLIADLGRITDVGAVFYHLGPWYWEFPSYLDVETSEDAVKWQVARTGNTISEVVQGGFDHPQSLAVVFPFEPRRARYVRLQHRGRSDGAGWTLSELQLWSGR